MGEQERGRTTQGPRLSESRSRYFIGMYDSLNAPVEERLVDIKTRLLGQAGGRVLEIGPGTGANLRYLGGVEQLTLVEPLAGMRRRLDERVKALGQPPEVKIVQGAAEALPVEDSSIDTVVGTFVLCSVASVREALAEVRRVLVPGGRYLFLEHTRGHGARLLVQKTLTPVMARYSAYCHLDRDLRQAISDAGFGSVEYVDPPSDRVIRRSLSWPLVAGSASSRN